MQMNYTAASIVMLNEVKGHGHILNPEYVLNQPLHLAQNDRILTFFCIQHKL